MNVNNALEQNCSKSGTKGHNSMTAMPQHSKIRAWKIFKSAIAVPETIFSTTGPIRELQLSTSVEMSYYRASTAAKKVIYNPHSVQTIRPCCGLWQFLAAMLTWQYFNLKITVNKAIAIPSCPLLMHFFPISQLKVH